MRLTHSYINRALLLLLLLILLLLIIVAFADAQRRFVIGEEPTICESIETVERNGRVAVERIKLIRIA